MKYLFSLLALLSFTALEAQTFQWNTKGGPANDKEVQPAGDLQTYDKAYNERQEGLAGIYNPSLHNSRTVYGETYNSTELTASHGILPLGTLVKLVNLDNNRTVTVRINDRGQECSDCLVMLSQAAADALGVNYRGRISAERVGFSNWNPAPPRTTYAPAPATYNSPQPTYNNLPATYGSASNSSAVVRPVTIGGQAVGWSAKGSEPAPVQSAPATYGNPTYPQQSQPAPTAPRGEYAVLGQPSVMSREVDPAVRANQPVTYSRRPTVVAPRPTQQSTYPSYGQPQVYQAPAPPTAQPQVYRQQAPVQQTYPAINSTPAQQAPTTQVIPQAAPPQPTVPRYQQKGGTVKPESYGQPAPARPVTYASVPATPQPAAQAAAPSGFAIQLGAYNNELYAQNRVNQLKASGLSNIFYLTSTKADGQVINRVYAGTFGSMAEAQTAANNIRNQHQIAGIVTKM